MSFTWSSIRDFAVEASDGRLGTVSDVLFDDMSWRIRWIVADVGATQHGRVVLLHPSVVARIDWTSRAVCVRLTTAEVEHSPDILLDEPVSRQIVYGERNRSDWEPALGEPRFIAGFWGGLGFQVPRARLAEETSMQKPIRGGGPTDAGDPHLRSVIAIIGNVVDASDGPFGHVHGFAIEDDWSIQSVIIDTHHWWPGLRLAIPVADILGISWPHHEVTLGIPRETAKASPAWKETDH